ncbi:hypothetical protein KX816_05270 [Sphingosinicellaceae bacterium]|nr:hypothetical protein KX816_05270 [Sphingosinicellaceae bacterium]
MRTVKSEFLAAEAAQDEAAIRTVRAVVAMLEARRDANVPMGVGVDEIAKATRAAVLSIEARQILIETHPELAKLPAMIGLGAWAYGDDGVCPPVDAPRAADQDHLKVVA